ncbi:MAG: hypothetical protein ACRDWA_08805 [Acidimicrobiia bacterium]
MPALILVGVIAGGLVLAVLWRGPRRVTEVPLSPDRLIASHAAGADYVDNYRAESSASSTLDIDSVEAAALQKGHLVARSEREVVYRDKAPGLVFFVSYALVAVDGTTGLELATIVHIERWKGHIYFSLVCPIHRFGLPWLTKYTLQRAASRAQ